MSDPSDSTDSSASLSKSEATALRIVTAATDRFLLDGYDDTTIAQVARDAGVANGTVLLHFGSKSQLATAAFTQQIADAVTNAAESLPDTDALGQLRHIAATLYEWYSSHQSIRSTLLREALFSEGPWSDRYAETVATTVSLFAAIIGDHKANGTLAADLDVGIAAEGTLADYLLVLLQGLRGTFDSAEEQADHFAALVSTRLGVAT